MSRTPETHLANVQEACVLTEGKTREAVERLFRGCSKERFVIGVWQISEILSKQDVDLVVAPLRGSAPICWSLEELNMQLGRNTPRILSVPTGTRIDIDTKQAISNTTLNEIYQIQSAYLSTLRSVSQEPFKTIALLDEARAGHSIAASTKQLKWVLENAYKEQERQCPRLISIKAQDERFKAQNGIGKDISDIPLYTVAMPMPYIDRVSLLPTIFAQNPAKRAEQASFKRHELLEIVDNLDAKDAFQYMIRKYINRHPELPEKLANLERQIFVP